MSATALATPEHQRPGRDTYRQHLLYASPSRRLSVVAPAGPGKTISIHVYGADIERLGSSILRRYDDVTQLGGAA